MPAAKSEEKIVSDEAAAAYLKEVYGVDHPERWHLFGNNTGANPK
jgi:hypothetical protein